MTWAIFACTLLSCAPEPLRAGIASLDRCKVLAAEFDPVPGIEYKCKEVK